MLQSMQRILKEEFPMPDPRKELAWTDEQDDDDQPAPYEATYRDGSLKNECWQDDR